MNPFPVIVVAESDVLAMDEITMHLAAIAPNATVICCNNGLDAWQTLTSRHADLLIINLRLSMLPGFVVMSKLVKEGWPTPPILLTGTFDSFLRHVLYQAPMPFLHQPSNKENLAKLLHNARHADLWQQVGGLMMFLQAFETRLSWQDKMRWLRLQGDNGEDCIKHIDDVFYLRHEPTSGKILIGTDHGEHWICDAFNALLIRLDAERFWRINRYTVINALHVVAAGRDYLGRQWLALRNGTRLKVSSAYERHDMPGYLLREKRVASA
jgi:DNA-binding LytR/AlgR family response regulator